VFSACTEDGVLAGSAWKKIIAAAHRLGFSEKEFAETIRSQAIFFVEHVLADAKSDGILTETEDEALRKLTATLQLGKVFVGYLETQLDALRIITLARQGQLPRIRPPQGLSLRAGEILHMCMRAKLRQRRMLKSGERVEEHVGHMAITDNRLLFCSATKSFDVRYRRIANHYGKTGHINVQPVGKPQYLIIVDEEEPVAYAILDAAIALSNQTMVAKSEGMPSRHIPRDIRQRAWQRYGGRCAECGSTQYLEFDHVIPVAKGGSNSDANVQLLCRGCNLKKSDFI
jgi:hypothetical protein